MRYAAVLLDVGDTLVGPARTFGSVYAEVFRDLGVPGSAEDFESALRAEWRRVSELHPPGRDRYAGGDERFWQDFAAGTLARLCGREGESTLVAEAVSLIRERFADPSAWEVFPDSRPALERLRAMSVRLAVVSNWDSRLPALLERWGIAGLLDEVVVSHLEGCEKPDPRIFRRAMEALGVSPARTLHVGDVPELDWAGARAAGCAARLVDRRGRLARGWRALECLGPLPALVETGDSGSP